MAFTAAAVAIVGGAATTGYQSKRAHDQTVQARHRMDDERAAQSALQKEQDDTEKAREDRAAEQVALRRRQALAMASRKVYGNIKTSPLGLPNQIKTGGNVVLGAA